MIIQKLTFMHLLIVKIENRTNFPRDRMRLGPQRHTLLRGLFQNVFKIDYNLKTLRFYLFTIYYRNNEALWSMVSDNVHTICTFNNLYI